MWRLWNISTQQEMKGHLKNKGQLQLLLYPYLYKLQRKSLFLAKLLSHLQTAVWTCVHSLVPTWLYHRGSKPTRTFCFSEVSFPLKYIHVESGEWELSWIMRSGGLRTREICWRAQGVYGEEKFFFSSQWIPQQLVVCHEMIAVARTVARDPWPACIMGISLASETKEAA